MSSDLLKELGGSEEFQQSLELIREDRQDYETFFEDVFKRLESTLTEAVQEQLTWEQQQSRKEAKLAEQSAEIQRQSRELETQRENFLAESIAAVQEQFQLQAQQHGQADLSVVDELESRLKKTLEDAGSERAALQDVLASSGLQADRLTSVAETMAAAQEQFQQQAQTNSQADLSVIGELESRLKATLEETLGSTSSQAERLTSVAEALTAAQEQFQQQAQQSGQADLSVVDELESRLEKTLEEAASERAALQDALGSTSSQADQLTLVAEALTAAQEQFQQQAQTNSQADLSVIGELESRLKVTLEETLGSTSSQAERLTSVAEALTAAQEQFQQQAQQSGQADLSVVDELESRLKKTLEEAGRERQALQDALASTGSQADRLASVADTLTSAQDLFQRQIEQREEISSDHGTRVASEEMLARLQQLEEERSEVLQGRSVLEAELESVRQRAVDLMTALEYQKSLASEQQSQLNDELRRQRQLLEQVLGRLAELEISPPNPAVTNNPATSAETVAAETDSVLSSVMSQFDVLQKDIARRRNKPAN
ncbi:MAG: hypothetical protein U9N87_05860 [Planctomycetota bacterium]|nr:hypothetical protein [Planctomycetota bacterium]